MDALLDLDVATFNKWLYLWAAMGVLSPLGMCFSKRLLFSNRYEDAKFSGLGTIDKKLGWIIMETPILIADSCFFLMGRIR